MPNKPSRIMEIDFIKGLLVFSMVIYHTFYNFHADYSKVILLTKYVSGGFIYLSGFLIGFYYLKNYSKDYSRIKKRLLTRAIKIFFIFFVFNIPLFYKILSVTDLGVSQIASNHFIFGTGMSRFEILLPISYLLFLLAFIAKYLEDYHLILNIVIFTVFCLIGMGIFKAPANLIYILIGLFGVANSFLIDRLKNNKTIQIFCIFLVIFLGWIRLRYSFGSNIILYIIYIILVLITFYNIAKQFNLKSLLSRWILNLGKYTLFSYIYQVIIIVSLSKLYQNKVNYLQNVLIIILVSGILIISLSILTSLRKRIKLFDKSYRLVFS